MKQTLDAKKKAGRKENIMRNRKCGLLLVSSKKRRDNLVYLHIGKDTLIDTNGIIAILNIETLEKKENLENVCKNINISDKIIDVSEKNKKSLIITVEKNETRGYISNISTSTLERRTNKIGGIK